MARTPQSQTREVMERKAVAARHLLLQGLTVGQISVQLRCSPTFVRRVRRELAERTVPTG
jgi:hypothetical protein